MTIDFGSLCHLLFTIQTSYELLEYTMSEKDEKLNLSKYQPHGLGTLYNLYQLYSLSFIMKSYNLIHTL